MTMLEQMMAVAKLENQAMLAGRYQREGVEPPALVSAQVWDLMSDGRERTADDVAIALSLPRNAVGRALGMLRKAGKVSRMSFRVNDAKVQTWLRADVYREQYQNSKEDRMTAILGLMADGEGRTRTQIVRALALNERTVSQTLTDLRKAGLVKIVAAAGASEFDRYWQLSTSDKPVVGKIKETAVAVRDALSSGPKTISQLIEKTGLSRSIVRRVVEGMVDAGTVTGRRSHGDPAKIYRLADA